MSVTPTVRNRSASTAVIETVAAREGVDPTELNVPLYETINPDALDQFVRHASEAGGETAVQLELTYYGYELVITADGSVRISGET